MNLPPWNWTATILAGCLAMFSLRGVEAQSPLDGTYEQPILNGIEPLPKTMLEAPTIDGKPDRAYEQVQQSDTWFGRLHSRQFAHRFDFAHQNPDDPSRYIGYGQPLIGTSWRNRPIHADLFGGTIMLQGLIPGEIQQSASFFDGVRLGYDFDHYWGMEARVGFAEGRLVYPTDTTLSGKSQLILLDYSMQFYPWGDATWRPYATFGLGGAILQYDDEFGRSRDQAQISMPFGLGVKYFIHQRISLRFEMLDNLTFGGADAKSANNFSVTAGFEYRFGGSSPGYFR
ncbi:porin family protein [Blastopirellula marina]|uniref:Outer membrane protein beta-barrel domain-containing protein n=1 Tax=Blastopirellula marina TaxID=124 RepID=A0A2S8GCV1_9BACT|nr:porin family protein [Blastopirellula marina]PQO42288.1 hypothetical protein C5Y93_28520 [Blastopirellula marina]